MEVDARANDAEQARLSAVSVAEQYSLCAKLANDRANNFEQQAKHAQQAQHDAQQKASRMRELERLVEQLMQQVMQVLALHQAPANWHCLFLAQTGRDKWGLCALE